MEFEHALIIVLIIFIAFILLNTHELLIENEWQRFGNMQSKAPPKIARNGRDGDKYYVDDKPYKMEKYGFLKVNLPNLKSLSFRVLPERKKNFDKDELVREYCLYKDETVDRDRSLDIYYKRDNVLAEDCAKLGVPDHNKPFATRDEMCVNIYSKYLPYMDNAKSMMPETDPAKLSMYAGNKEFMAANDTKKAMTAVYKNLDCDNKVTVSPDSPYKANIHQIIKTNYDKNAAPFDKL